jgi:hypothetical protein
LIFISTRDKPALIAFSTPEWLEAARRALAGTRLQGPHRRHAQRFSGALQPGALSGRHHRGTVCREQPEENLTLKALQNMPVNQRRHATIILLGDSFQTFTPMEAFQNSVHAVINSAEMFLLKQLTKKPWPTTTFSSQLPRSPKPRLHIAGTLNA